MFFGESRSILSYILIKIPFYPILRSASMVEIHFTWHVENLKLFFSQKSQFDLVENIKNQNKKRTRTSLFKSLEDGKQEICFMWPYVLQTDCTNFKTWIKQAILLLSLHQSSLYLAKCLLCSHYSTGSYRGLSIFQIIYLPAKNFEHGGRELAQGFCVLQIWWCGFIADNRHRYVCLQKVW